MVWTDHVPRQTGHICCIKFALEWVEFDELLRTLKLGVLWRYRSENGKQWPHYRCEKEKLWPHHRCENAKQWPHCINWRRKKKCAICTQKASLNSDAKLGNNLIPGEDVFVVVDGGGGWVGGWGGGRDGGDGMRGETTLCEVFVE